jgi:hypothetical protein
MSGLALINIDEANFKLKRLKTEDVYIGAQDFTDLVSTYYTSRVIREGKKMALSIGFFGSPRTLIKHLRDGFSDFYELPVEGWQERGLIGGLAGAGYGTLSLTKNVGVGLIQSIQMLNQSASQVLLLLG